MSLFLWEGKRKTLGNLGDRKQHLRFVQIVDAPFLVKHLIAPFCIHLRFLVLLTFSKNTLRACMIVNHIMGVFLREDKHKVLQN